jgi:hemerythrin
MNSTTKESESSLGIRLIDVDHKEIARLIGELQMTAAESGDRCVTLNILGKLAAFSRTHFALEEGLMSATEYPGYAAHRGCHQQLLQQLDGFVSLYSKGELALDRESLDFLFVWYAAHSKHDDAQYASWLAVRDVSPGQIDVSKLPAGGWTSSVMSGKTRSGTPVSRTH